MKTDCPSKITRARIIDSLVDYQKEIAEDRHVVLLFGGFGKEIPVVFQDLICLTEETLCFKGLDLETLDHREIVVNHQLINFVLTFVEWNHTDSTEKLEKPLEIKTLIDD